MIKASPGLRPTAAAALLLLSIGLARDLPASRTDSPAPPAVAACSGGALSHLGLRSFRLANGMTFLLVERPDPTRVAAGWVARVGSADDPTGLTGTSHVLEHMMFKGTRTIGVQDPNELDVVYKRAGATLLNAFTQHDLTAFFVSLPANELELWCWLESDRLLAPVFRGLDGERKVIEQERKSDEPTPLSRLQGQFNALFWQAHPYRWPLFGWPSDVAAVSAADVERHFHTYFTPGNLTAVLVGHVDRPEVEELARRYFGRIAPRPEPPRTPTLEPDQLAETRMNAVIEGPAQLQVRYHSVPFRHPDSYSLEVLAGLFNGPGGRLHAALMQTSALAEEAASEQVSYRRAGFFSLTARASGDREPEQLEQAWYEVLRRLEEEPVSPEELERAKNRLAADAFRQLEDPFSLMVRLLTAAGLGEWNDLDEHACRVAAVSAEEVRRVARTYFKPQNRTVGLYHAARGERQVGHR